MLTTPRANGGTDAGAAPRILLIQPRWIGDVLLCTPAIRAVRRAFPNARIDFLTELAGADVLSGNPHLTEILISRRGLSERLRLVRRIRAHRYGAVVDFRSTPSTAQIVAVSGARQRVGVRGRGPRNLVYTTLVQQDDSPEYVARRKLDLLEPIGIAPASVPDLSLEIALGPAERARADAIWRAHHVDPHHPVVAVSPVSRVAFKQWGVDRWRRVVDAISRMGVRVLVTSGPGERETAARVAEGAASPAVWDYGPTSVRELAALYERCVLWVGNDGGPKHVAAAAGIATITVSRWRIGSMWTDTRPGSPHLFIERAPPQGCDRRCGRCPHRGCLANVAPEEVISAVRVALIRASSP